MEYLRLCVGIDVAQKELVCCYGALDTSLVQHVLARRSFENSLKGFEALFHWVEKAKPGKTAPIYVMEATGVYHQNLAHWLHSNHSSVVVVLPNKVSNFMRTMNLKTITDASSADAICQFGLEKQLQLWTPPNAVYVQLQQLTRERDQLINERTIISNQLHALESGAFVHQPTLHRLNERKVLLDVQEAAIKAEIHQLIGSDSKLQTQVALITSIPGIAETTAAVILGETNGFELIRNKRQLSSYAGLDVAVKESGTSVKTKSRLSKKGNTRLRKAMHMPALSAIRHCQVYNRVFNRLQSRSGVKMKAVVAVQRKLLELTYIIHKTQKPFDPGYETRKEQSTRVVAPSESGLCRFL